MGLKDIIMDDLKVWWGAFARGWAVLIVTAAGVAVTSGLCWDAIEAGIVSGALMMGAELLKYYKIDNTIQRTTKTKKHTFILFP